jgi:DnaK suppressor protein
LTSVKDKPLCAAHDENITSNYGNSTMTKLDTTPFKAQLLAHRASLLEQLATLRGGDRTRVEASVAHFAEREDSQAQTNTAKDLEFALDSLETAELNAVQAALQRIDAGTYGECTDCGIHIPAARLHATPEAPRCIHCQEKAERV